MTPAEFTHLKYDFRDHVAIVTLDRPEVRNALNAKAYSELESVFRSIQSDEQVRAVYRSTRGAYVTVREASHREGVARFLEKRAAHFRGR